MNSIELNSRTVRLFHGTSSHAADIALARGLQPRGKNGQSNWVHSIESNPDTVYLTDVYAPYFAVNAVDRRRDKGHRGQLAAIIEVENTAKLRDKLVPDEDFLEQATRNSQAVIDQLGTDMKARTRFFRDTAKQRASLWPESIKHLGTVGHLGPISRQKILRVAYVDLVKLSWVPIYASDAQIMLMNHRFCADKYRNLTEWIFGRSFTPREWLGDAVHSMMTERDLEHLANQLTNRDGIEVVNGNAITN